MDVKGIVSRGFQALAVTGVLCLAGCMTLESPETQYILTSEGFKDIGKPTKQTDTQSGQSVVKDIDSKTVSVQKPASSDWTANQEGAWGFCCRQGRGLEPEPMTAFEFSDGYLSDLIGKKSVTV